MVTSKKIQKEEKLPPKEISPIYRSSTPEEKELIRKAVQRTVEEYGEALKKMGKE